MLSLLENLLSPAILFFVLGLVAAFFKSDLDFPSPLPKAMSLFLLLAIGFKGGIGLRAGIDLTAAYGLLIAVGMSVIVPLVSFYILKRFVDVPNAAAIAATYGSVSAVTFITATAFLQKQGITYQGWVVAALALMESPAIVIGVLLARVYSTSRESESIEWKTLLHEAFFNGPVLLLIGAMVIGAVSAEASAMKLQESLVGAFGVVLAIFLLDMGLLAGRQMNALKRAGGPLGVFAIILPTVAALIAIGLCWLVGIGPAETLLLAILCGSASYIAVPAVMRLAIPEANPSLYVPMALAITFPFNVVAGIPMYWSLIKLIER